nr:MAG TPA: hypothetical protein [Bacteriophage sp.]
MVGPVPILTTTRRGNSPAAVFLERTEIYG